MYIATEAVNHLCGSLLYGEPLATSEPGVCVALLELSLYCLT